MIYFSITVTLFTPFLYKTFPKQCYILRCSDGYPAFLKGHDFFKNKRRKKQRLIMITRVLKCLRWLHIPILLCFSSAQKYKYLISYPPTRKRRWNEITKQITCLKIIDLSFETHIPRRQTHPVSHWFREIVDVALKIEVTSQETRVQSGVPSLIAPGVAWIRSLWLQCKFVSSWYWMVGIWSGPWFAKGYVSKACWLYIYVHT